MFNEEILGWGCRRKSGAPVVHMASNGLSVMGYIVFKIIST